LYRGANSRSKELENSARDGLAEQGGEGNNSFNCLTRQQTAVAKLETLREEGLEGDFGQGQLVYTEPLHEPTQGMAVLQGNSKSPTVFMVLSLLHQCQTEGQIAGSYFAYVSLLIYFLYYRKEQTCFPPSAFGVLFSITSNN